MVKDVEQSDGSPGPPAGVPPDERSPGPPGGVPSDERSPGPPADERHDRLPGLPAGVPADERHETANLLHSAALRLLRLARTADDVLDLDGPRASLLSVLVFAGPLSVSGLAELERVSPPAITKTVALLESAGLARRTRSSTDRRVVLVSATPAGRRLLERGRAARVRTVAALFADASDGELRTLHTAAHLIATRL